MSTVIIKVGGVELHAAREDVAAILRDLNIPLGAGTPQQSAPKPQPLPMPAGTADWPIPNGQAFKPKQGALLIEAPGTYDFLKAISDAGAEGITGDDLAKVMGIKHPKGLGSKAAVWNREISSFGFAPALVYSNSRDSGGVRYWRPGVAIGDVLGLMERGPA